MPTTANQGDIYLVGPMEDGSFDEYYWRDPGVWELMGSTAANMGGYITINNLYAGENGTRTPDNPAEGTILAIVNSQNRLNFLAKDNIEEYTPTEDYNPATKKYVDDMEIYATEADIDKLFENEYKENLATKEDIDKLFE